MCFSATASFLAGGTLTAAGILTLKKNNNKRGILLASIPLLFGIQQFMEGIVWITPISSPWHQIATYAFLSFALALWPFFVPLSIFLIEKNALRKKIISYFLILGCAIAVYSILLLILNPISSEICTNSIRYIVNEPYMTAATILYVIATCGGPLASSHKTLFIFGIVLVLSLLISLQFYRHTFISVWCFFGAVLSLIIYLHFRKTATK